MIDFVTLMLINMAAGLLVLAWYVAKGLDAPDQPRWAAAFAVPGLVGILNGFRVTWTWPLPGSYNTSYGETSVMLGALLLGAAWSLTKNRDMLPLCVYAFLAGLAAILIGVRIVVLGLTLVPLLTGLGFVLTGAAGVFAGITLRLRSNMLVRIIGALVLTASAAIWALNGYLGYWDHLQRFAGYVPK